MRSTADAPAAVAEPVSLCAALADPTRWRILELLGAADSSASDLAAILPISRQAIAKHVSVLESVGLVEAVPAGRAIRYRAHGAALTRLADQLAVIGRGWDTRLGRLKDVAQALHRG